MSNKKTTPLSLSPIEQKWEINKKNIAKGYVTSLVSSFLTKNRIGIEVVINKKHVKIICPNCWRTIKNSYHKKWGPYGKNIYAVPHHKDPKKDNKQYCLGGGRLVTF